LQASTNLVMGYFDQLNDRATLKESEGSRLASLAGAWERAGSTEAFSKTGQYASVATLMQQHKLNTGYMGELNFDKLQEYLRTTNLDAHTQTVVWHMLSGVAGNMNRPSFGPAAPTPEQKLQQLLFEKGKVTPEKPKVDVNVTITQNISQAEDPERILIRTKQAIEDALIRPIESGDNRFSVLR